MKYTAVVHKLLTHSLSRLINNKVFIVTEFIGILHQNYDKTC